MTNLGQGDCAWSENIPRLYNYVPMVDLSGSVNIARLSLAQI